MSKLIHVGSVVQAVFGTIDENGNVVNKQPMSVEIPKLDHDSFTAACDALTEARDKAVANATTRV